MTWPEFIVGSDYLNHWNVWSEMGDTTAHAYDSSEDTSYR